LIGCERASTPQRAAIFVTSNPHRLVTISVSKEDPQKCEVDYPSVLVRSSKHHTIAWAAEDNEYWIKFDAGGSPIDPANRAIDVPRGSQTSPPFDIPDTATLKYYKYAIYTSNPDTNPANPPPTPCKNADDDHDTGLNVKR